MKMLIILSLLSIASLANATDSVIVYHGDLSPSQVEWMLNNQGASQEQRGINNARRAQQNAEQYENDYNNMREYYKTRRETERFIGN
jgi:hypothetical protein